MVLLGDGRALRRSLRGPTTHSHCYRGRWRRYWDSGPCSSAAPMQSLQQQSLGASEIAQLIKSLTLQAWRPEFDHQNPHKGGRRKPLPHSCLLTFTCTPRHAREHANVHTHKHTYTEIKGETILKVQRWSSGVLPENANNQVA